MKDVADFICQVGFPIFVAVYFMFFLNRSIGKLEKAIEALTDWLQKSKE